MTAKELHQRWLARRIVDWQGRISDYAVDQSLRFYELTFLAFLTALVSVILGTILGLSNIEPFASICWVSAFVTPAICLGAAYRHARAATRDIGQQYGFDRRMAAKARIKNRTEFEHWLARIGWSDGPPTPSDSPR